MNTFKKYAILSGYNPSEVASFVTDMLKKGWEMHGPLNVCIDGSGRPLYTQSMVLEEDDANLP